MNDRRGFIEDEVFAIQHSGEMPEVALHTSLYCLREDPEGPRLHLSPEDIQGLKDAVEKRYRRIVMRDLNPRYRHRSIYRGLARSAANWLRLARFAHRENRDIRAIQLDVAAALRHFLEVETADVAAGRHASSVNCTAAELEAFAEAVGLRSSQLPEGWQGLCTGTGD